MILPSPMSAIRTFGDPVLSQKARELDNIDGKTVALSQKMVAAMIAENGLGVAATQVGSLSRMFVYDLRDGKGVQTIVNPVLTEHAGESLMVEGCLSVPGHAWEIVRPERVCLTGLDLDGNSVEVEASGLLARLYQHEVDHLDGVLLLEHLDADERVRAKKMLRSGEIGRKLPVV